MSAPCIKIGNTVDVLSNQQHTWSIATIIDFYEDQIKIRYDTDDDSDVDEWININQMLPLHTNTLHYIPLNIPSNDIVISNTKSNLIFYKKAHCLLLITLSDQTGTKTIYTYDITNDQWHNFGNYISKTTSVDTVTIDENNDLLYIFGTGYNNYCPILEILDINKRIIAYSQQIDCMKLCNVFNPHLCRVTNNKSELHLISTINLENTNHFSLGTSKSTMATTLSRNLDFEPNFMRFCEQTNQLIAVNNFGSIFVCNLKSNNIPYVWNKFEIELDVEIDACFTFLTYNHFLMMFVLYYDENAERDCREIWFIDLLEHKIFKSHKNAPEILFEYAFLGTIDTKMHSLHLIIDGDEEIEHFKLYLMDIIPKNMTIFYQQKHYKHLIYGYVVKIPTLQTKPYEIIDLLLSFYPPFL